MIKAVAGGLHFETINRPLGADSNSEPSISVSPALADTEGGGHAEGERVHSSPGRSQCTPPAEATEEFLTL